MTVTVAPLTAFVGKSCMEGNPPITFNTACAESPWLQVTWITYSPGGACPITKLPFTIPVPTVMATAPESARIGLKELLEPLMRVHEVSVGRNPVPLTSIRSPIRPVCEFVDECKVSMGPLLTIKIACAKSPWLPVT